jgi:hypothetical protein
MAIKDGFVAEEQLQRVYFFLVAKRLTTLLKFCQVVFVRLILI